MPVYKFSHQLLAVLVHLAHTAVKSKTNFLIDVGDKLVNTDDTALMKYEKKFMQKTVKKPCLRNKFLRRTDLLRFYAYICHMSDIIYLSFKQH